MQAGLALGEFSSCVVLTMILNLMHKSKQSAVVTKSGNKTVKTRVANVQLFEADLAFINVGYHLNLLT